MGDWYVISNVDRIDSPALAFYPDRISGNIELAKRIIGDTNRLRPHVKTNKAAEVSRMLLDAGIRKFKCATIAEAEMLGHINAPDVLLAYQPVGPKISRLLDLIKAYPATHYSCLVDQAENARAISALCEAGNITSDVFIDLNIGALRAKRLHERLCRAHGVVAFGRDALAAHAAHVYVDERVFARFGADGIADVDGGDHAVEQMIAAGAARDVERQIHFCITFDRRRKHILPSLPSAFAMHPSAEGGAFFRKAFSPGRDALSPALYAFPLPARLRACPPPLRKIARRLCKKIAAAASTFFQYNTRI